jgi:hypothetical protein
MPSGPLIAGTLLGALVIVSLVYALYRASRSLGAAADQNAALTKSVELSNAVEDAGNVRPPDDAATADWLRTGGRGS